MTCDLNGLSNLLFNHFYYIIEFSHIYYNYFKNLHCSNFFEHKNSKTNSF